MSNFALGIIVARLVSVEEFAAFSLAYVAYLLAVGALDGTVSDALIVRYPSVSEMDRKAEIGGALGLALPLSFLAALVILAISLAFTGDVRLSLLALAATLPGLLIQEVIRMIHFAMDHQKKAAANDAVWCAFQILLIGAAVGSGSRKVPVFIGCWGVAATIASLYGFWQLKVTPKLHDSARWFRQHRTLALPFVGEFMLTTGAFQSSFYLFGVMGELRVVAGLRGALLLVNPLNLLLATIPPLAIPAAVRLRKRAPDAMNRLLMLLGSVLAAISVLWGAGVLLIPQSFGQEILGDTWAIARVAILPVTFSRVLLALRTTAQVGLRAAEAPKRSFVVLAISSPLGVAAAVTGAALSGTAGAAWGFAAGESVAVILMWLQVRRIQLPTMATAGTV